MNTPAQFTCLCGKDFPVVGDTLFSNLCPDCVDGGNKCSDCGQSLAVQVGHQGREIIAYCANEKCCRFPTPVEFIELDIRVVDDF